MSMLKFILIMRDGEQNTVFLLRGAATLQFKYLNKQYPKILSVDFKFHSLSFKTFNFTSVTHLNIL